MINEICRGLELWHFALRYSVKFLMNQKVDIAQPDNQVVISKYESLLLLSHHASVTFVGDLMRLVLWVSKGTSVLHVAAEEGNIDVMEYLMERVKIDPTIHDVDGDTPFHAAARAGKLEGIPSV